MQVEWKQSLHLGQIWGGLCGILKEAPGQESNSGAWEGERIWRTGGVEWEAWGSRQRHLSTHLQDGSGNHISLISMLL